MADIATFVVRIYRRHLDGSVAHGVVEPVGRGDPQPFASAVELWEQMRSRPAQPHAPGNPTDSGETP